MGNSRQVVLLTGGAGFIGSHVAEALLQRGHSVAIIDNLDDFYEPAWKKANLEDIHRVGGYQFFDGDICAQETLREVVAQVKPDAVIHLAARAGVRPSIEMPRLYEQVNVGGTLNLLEICREFHVGKFIFGSSSSVYGATSHAPFSESQMELRPISPYAATKLAGEMLCYAYAHLFKLSVICLRFFTVYGPRQRPDLAIHKFTALIEAGRPLPIFGDGLAGRDYTYIDDIVAGVLAALEYGPPRNNQGVGYEVFNLGDSRPVKLLELVKMLENVTRRKAVLEHHPLQPGDVPLTWADVSKANRVLGYRPKTPLEEGLQRFVVWYREADSTRRLQHT